MKKIFILISVVLLTTIVQLNAQEWSGTGFALNRGYIVTNYHVVKDAQTIKVSGINGSFNVSYRAVVVATDKVNDVAIIKISDSKFKGFGTLPYRVTMQMAEVGDDIFVLGYPLTQTMGDEIKLTNGIISARTGFMGDVSLYQMSAPIQPGNSGGPMFDSKGNVVGIVCASHDKAENVGYAIKTAYLKNLAESASLSGIFPTNNTVASLPLSGKVKSLKKFVYQIHCSNQSMSSISSSSTSHSSGGYYSPPTSRQNFTETALGIDMQMIWVEGGSFLMGCTSEQGNDCEDDEKNVRRVTLDGFYIGMLEVTQSQWETVMGTTVYQQRNKAKPDWPMKGVGSDYPMYYVSWNEAMDFCRELSRLTGKTYTLPTEAQWEYAARGGTKADGRKYAGSNYIDTVAWHKFNSGNSTHRCGTKRANGLGIYDMTGNVSEWCKDWYSSSYTSYDTNNPSGPSSGFGRVLRGGSWDDYDSNICRVAYRGFGSPSRRDFNLGFRVVCLP